MLLKGPTPSFDTFQTVLNEALWFEMSYNTTGIKPAQTVNGTDTE